VASERLVTGVRSPQQCVDCGQRMVPLTRLQGSRRRDPADRHLVRHSGRGLCERCYHAHDRAGTLLNFPKASRTRDEVLADVEALRVCGLSKAQIAERLNMSFKALDRAITRARQAGHVVLLGA
jgi:hypothetical protein